MWTPLPSGKTATLVRAEAVDVCCNVAQRDCGPGSVGIRSDQVCVAVVVVVSGIDGIGKCKATDAWLLVGLECAVAVSLIDQSAGAASGNNVRDSVTVDIGKMRIGWDVGGISDRRLKGAVTVSEKNKEAVANECRRPAA